MKEKNVDNVDNTMFTFKRSNFNYEKYIESLLNQITNSQEKFLRETK